LLVTRARSIGQIPVASKLVIILVLVKAEAYANQNKGIKSPLDMLRRP
jgi:hypothetical protein